MSTSSKLASVEKILKAPGMALYSTPAAALQGFFGTGTKSSSCDVNLSFHRSGEIGGSVSLAFTSSSELLGL
jgi:hypothetical protein